MFLDLTQAADGLEPYEHLLRSAARSHHPILDMGIPTRETMVAILDAIDDAHVAGRTVYAHCWGGIGRTGTVVGCWLVRHGSSADQAIELIRSRRASIPKFRTYPDSPQTREQRRFVRDWQSGL